MDEEIEEMVAKNVQSSQIIVEGKGEIGKDSNRFWIVDLNELLEPGEGEVREKDAPVFDDVGIVIELEGDTESVSIRSHGDDRHRADHEKVFEREGAGLR